MTYGRSVYKALDNFGINRETWHELAADRPAWRGALHGSLLAAGRPSRAAAATTNHRIAVSVADARASYRNIRASIATSHAHAALHGRAPPPPPSLPPPPPPPPPPPTVLPPPLRRSARIRQHAASNQ